MKKLTLFISAFIFLLSSCSNNKINVEGVLEGNKHDGKTAYLYAVLSSNFDEPKLLSTATIENGKVVFEGLEQNANLKEKDVPTIGFLSLFDMLKEDFDENSEEPIATLILEKGTAKVNFMATSVELSGTKNNEEFNKMHLAITDIVSFAQDLGPTQDIDNMQADAEGRDGRAQFQVLNEKLQDSTFALSKANMQNNVGQFLFIKSYIDNLYTPDQMLELINLSTDEFRLRADVKELKEILDTMGQQDSSGFDDSDFDIEEDSIME